MFKFKFFSKQDRTVSYYSLKPRALIFSILCFPSFVLGAEQNVSKNLSLKNYLDLLKTNDPVYQQLDINQLKTDFIIEEGIAGREYQFDLEGQRGFGDDGIDTNSISATLSKEILETGTRFSLSHSSAENTNINEDISQIEVEQDLLKNAFGKEQGLQRRILDKTQRLERLEVLENYEEYLAGKIKLYLEFSQAAMELELSKSLLNSSENLYQYINSKYKKNAANSTDIKRARLQVILREEELITNKENFDNIQQGILLAVNLDEDTLYPEQGLELLSLYPDDTKFFEAKRFRQYQVILLQSEIIEDEYELAKDDDLAELSLVGGYKVDQSTTSVNRKESSVGLRLSVPFKNAKASAQKKIKALDLKYGELDQLKVSQNLQSEYQSLSIKLEKLKKQHDLSKEKLELMQAVLEDENLRYRRGQIDTDKIIETTNTYALYQFEENQHLLELNKSYLDWLVLNDRLIK